jgi:hypothetical protein
MIPQSGAAMRPHAVGLKIRSSLQLYGSFECLKSISDFYASMATDLTNATLIDSLARGMLKHSGAKFLWLVQRKEKTCYCRMRSWRVICCEHKAEPTKLKPGPIGLQKSQSPRNCSGSLSRRLANCTRGYCKSPFFCGATLLHVAYRFGDSLVLAITLHLTRLAPNRVQKKIID